MLVARNVLADELMERALRGTTETMEDGDRVVVRKRHDNRLAMAMLNRLDRMADAAKAPAHAAAARMVATDFPQYLDLVARDGGPARAGVFLGARVEAAGEDELAPIRALARADRWLRTHTDLAEPIDTADLDPAGRAGWSAEQWARAEAAGLVRLAPEPEPEPEPEDPADAPAQACQPCQPEAPEAELPPGHPAGAPVWWAEWSECWRTRFPPSDDFDGDEDGEYGFADYSRTLTDAETLAWEAEMRADIEAQRLREAAERDAFFAEAAGLAGERFVPGVDACEDEEEEEEEEDGDEWDDAPGEAGGSPSAR